MRLREFVYLHQVQENVILPTVELHRKTFDLQKVTLGLLSILETACFIAYQVPPIFRDVSDERL